MEREAHVRRALGVEVLAGDDAPLIEKQDQPVGRWAIEWRAKGEDRPGDIERRKHLVARPRQCRAAIAGEAGRMGVNLVDAQFGHEVEAGPDTHDAGHVGRADVQAGRGRGRRQVIGQPVDIIDRGIGMDQARPHGLGHDFPHVEKAGAGQGQQRLLAAGRQHVDVHGLHVEAHVADSLDGIDDEQDLVGPAELADGRQVGAVAGQELHGADRHGAGVLVAEIGQTIQRQATAVGRHAARRHAVAGQTHPRVGIGRKLHVAEEDVIARLPDDGLGDSVERGAGGGSGHDLGRRSGVDMAGYFPADFLERGHDLVGEVAAGVAAQCVNGGLDGPFAALRQGGDGGVIEIDLFRRLGKFYAAEVFDIVHSGSRRGSDDLPLL
ncbi:protein of unknown function [Candidatus Promineifilum breve]|uniref:Uncharacterized protein n=1 Tax=Candidatus Promineifilum breve TaxID=1806508 RepID=A0A160SYW4_9CHLR|nr:protein of unknown function [Candidatus Promineifilum breve]